MRSFARSWSVDLKEQGIRVNVVSPGMVPTEGYQTNFGMDTRSVDGFVASVLPGIPLGRVGEPADIASAVTFLASNDSSWITGIDLVVDGGFSQI